jgi:predicted ArsR family transcriptional regulator
MKQDKTEAGQAAAIDIEKIKALGNIDRARILDILIKKGPMYWTDIQNELKVNPNTLNFHLTKLLHSEFIKRDVVENKKQRPATLYQIQKAGESYYNAYREIER